MKRRSERTDRSDQNSRWRHKSAVSLCEVMGDREEERDRERERWIL